MPQEKVALITGVSSGIGQATAILLSSQGFKVFGTMRRPAESDGQRRDVQVVQLDVREEGSVRSCVQAVLDRTGRIDVLVNNAGYTLIGSLEETSVEEARSLFETNFCGVLRMSQAVLPVMREQRYGRIINIGSVAGFVPVPFQGIYSASKHAIEGFSESLDHEVRQFGIRVSVIEPGFTRTDMDHNRQIAGHLLAAYSSARDRILSANPQNIAKGEDPVRVASVVLEVLRSRTHRLRYLAGREARFTNMLRKFLPSTLFDRGLRKQFGLAVV
jgi:NAD(P)-dependent dehydrogenase (short-subunit alcohol dehydrogenase family)